VGDPLLDGSREGPIPVAWRSPLQAIVDALVRREATLATGLSFVEPVPPDISHRCLEVLDAYGTVTLVPLPEESWESSIARWLGDRWRCLVDLWTKEEGRSDLVLDVDVFENAAGRSRFRVNTVHAT
jgi:hypothetical protein